MAGAVYSVHRNAWPPRISSAFFFCDGKCENEILRGPITLQGNSHGSGYQRPRLHVSQLNDCEHAGDTPLTVVVFWIRFHDGCMSSSSVAVGAGALALAPAPASNHPCGNNSSIQLQTQGVSSHWRQLVCVPAALDAAPPPVDGIAIGKVPSAGADG